MTPAPLTIMADNQTRVYGAADPPFTVSYSGFVNGDTLASSDLSGSVSLTSSDSAASPVGPYPIVAAQGTLTSQDYVFDFVNGTLTVTQEVLTVDSAQTVPSLEVSANVQVVVGAGGDLAVNGPVTFDANGSLSIVDGGIVTAPGINSLASATGIELEGGTLRATANFTTSVPVTIGASGGTIDSNGYNVSFVGNLTGLGGLEIVGTGSVDLAGTNTYGGGTTASSGTIIVSAAAALPVGSALAVGAGGVFIFDPTAAAVTLASPAANANVALVGAVGRTVTVAGNSSIADLAPVASTVSIGDWKRVPLAVSADAGSWRAPLPDSVGAIHDMVIQEVASRHGRRFSGLLEATWGALNTAFASRDDGPTSFLVAVEVLMAEYGRQ